ncbi:MAG: hypothetical protein FWE08_08845 [Oscillospiraceae bacterium]|nr:hypothetical protein [Oscillospiraceae bacterium]
METDRYEQLTAEHDRLFCETDDVHKALKTIIGETQAALELLLKATTQVTGRMAQLQMLEERLHKVLFEEESL